MTDGGRKERKCVGEGSTHFMNPTHPDVPIKEINYEHTLIHNIQFRINHLV